MGYSDWIDGGVSLEGTNPSYASAFHQSHSCGPTGDQRDVRMPCVQEQVQRTHLCVDFQPEDQRKAIEVDFSRRCFVVTSLNRF